jgi:hypothetical protein
MGLSSEQVGSQAEQNWEIDEIQKAYATKYGSAPAPTPTPLGEVSNQPSSGQQVGVTTGGVALYGTIPQVQSLSAPAPIYKSLIDIANSRPDVLNTAKAQGGDPFTAGTKANTWLNDWWNSAGKNEYPDTQLQTITPESLKNEKGIDLSGTGTTTKIVTPKVTIVSAGETIKSIDDYIKESTPTKSAADLEVEKWTKQAQEALGQEAGKSAMLTSELEKEGATDITKNLKDTQSKIKIKTAELQQMIADEESKPVTMRSMQGTIYQKSKVIQSDIMFLQATASALQGDLTFAQQQAQASVDAKYGPIEESLAIAQAQLKLLEPLLTKEEKIIAAARTQMYNDQQQAVADAKTLENNINNIILTAAKNAAPQDVLNAIAGTTSVTDAIQAAGTWLQEKTATTGTTDMQEYAMAQSQGYTGTLLDWQTRQANLKATTGQPSSYQEWVLAGKPGTYENWLNKQKIPAAEQRDTEVSTYLQNNKGTDGFVSASVYQNALTKFIAGGGNQTNFTAAYPQQTYLRQEEIDKLPAALKPQIVTTKSDLTTDQLSTINDAKSAIDQVKQRYGDWNTTRDQIIQQVKQSGWDISPYI